METKYLKNKDCPQLTVLILLIDSDNEQLKLREDGKSLSRANEIKLNSEREKFLEAFEKSLFPNKMKFDLSNYYFEGPQPKKTVDTKSILDEITAFIKR